ncbi:MAG: cell division protein FtsZ [Deltaproteobacteria bacterium]|nr:cell division protein FtsZ [Deltaproteobacteria bacterium]MBW2209452.1 cell division protein FtsZ [Deltaproteobacteria bacterium]MBW2549181.1 cell division protein FtsZ [Deltaproteobacteria bacterium]MBW2625997.1 cell division protein FtsZ [Deltaproteobacteria bacterium]MBW2684302.1 cell division protein FtsZ [Deltaproteobacteria bacterium]
MAISIEFADDAELHARIKVVGVGGSGGNALNTMIQGGLEGVEFIAANTDAQALDRSLAPVKLQLGPELTRGLGAGGNPDVGRKAALEDVQRLSEALEGADMVFITAGMGGGTGTGAAPIISQVAQDQGALTVGVVTRPFLFEGRKRAKNAERGVQELIDTIDSIITIPNQRLMSLGDDDITMLDAFARADDVLLQAVQGISDLIINAGMINVDFADVKTIMASNGRALMGTGIAKGDRRALEAAEMAVNSPLLDEVSVQGATGILINFTAGPDIKLREINEAAGLVQQAAHEEAEIIFGVVTDPGLADTVKVTVIATGFEKNAHAPIPLGLHHAVVSNQSSNGVSANRAMRGAPPRAEDFSSTLEGVPAAVSQPAGTRAFGASALHDEAVLDIPAYLRRGTPTTE